MNTVRILTRLILAHLEDPEVLLGQVSEVDAFLGFKVECQLASIPKSLSATSLSTR